MHIAIAGVVTKPIIAHPLGGTEAFTYLLVKGLVKRGHEVTLYCAEGSKTDAQHQVFVCSPQDAMRSESNVEFVYPYTLLEIRKILQDIKSSRFDLLHVNFLKTFLLSYFASDISIPVLHTMHRDFMSSKHFYDVYNKIGFHDNEHFAFVSKRAQALSLLQANTQVVYNGIDVAEYLFEPSSGQEQFLWLSRIDPLKGPKDAILAAKSAGVKMVLSGDIDREKYQDYFSSEISPLLSTTITYEKPGTLEHKIDLYQKSRACVFPIQWEEPFGLVMVEAMACGTPVIAYNRGSVSEIVRDGLTGFIIDPDSEDPSTPLRTSRPGKGSWIIKKQGVEGLVEAIKRIGEIDRTVCRQHVVENFTIDKMVDGYEKVYEKVIASQGLTLRS